MDLADILFQRHKVQTILFKQTYYYLLQSISIIVKIMSTKIISPFQNIINTNNSQSNQADNSPKISKTVNQILTVSLKNKISECTCMSSLKQIENVDQEIQANFSFDDIPNNISSSTLCVYKQQQQQKSSIHQISQNNDIDYQNLQNYKIEQILGSGQFGDVYKAIYLPHQLELAIKIVNMDNFDVDHQKQINKYLNNEQLVCKKMKTFSSLHFLPKTYAVFQKKQSVYFVTELFYGFTLQDLIKSSCISLGPKQIRFYLHSLILAIKEMHDNLSCIHRDIKPQNIMILADGNLKLIDFGCSKQLNSCIKTSSVIGTYQYFSPQRFQSQYGKQADIWAFAVIAYQLVFKDLPFKFKDIDQCEEQQKFYRLAKIINKRKKFRIKETELIDHDLKQIIQGIFNANKKEREQQWSIQYILDKKYFQDCQIQSQQYLSELLLPPRNFSIAQIQNIKQNK